MTKDKNLKNIVTSIRSNFNDESVFIDKVNNTIINIKDIYIDFILNRVQYKAIYDWQEEDIKLVKEIIIDCRDKYIKLPKLEELFHLYSVMDEFIQERLSEEEKEDILNIIGGANRYKRFIESIQGTDLEVLFEIFIHDKIEYEIKNWLKEKEINY